MAENQIQPGPGTQTPVTDSSIVVQDNVKSIPQNKHESQKVNYNSGNIGLKCIINGFCPILRKFLVEDTFLLNNETIKCFPDDEVRNLNSVPNLPGIYLRERYNYLSNFLYVNGKPAVNNYIESPDQNSNFSYDCEQSFDAVNSIFDEEGNHPVDGFSGDYPAAGRAVWQYIRHNEPMDTISTGDNSGQNPYGKNPIEFNDSNVNYLAQVNSTSNPFTNKGIHWKADKMTQLFQGEDFFITFRRAAVATDASNLDSLAFTNHKYDFLDVSFNETFETEYPKNAAVVGYKKIVKEQETGTAEKITIEKYQKDPDTIKFFDFNKQAYYVIEIGPDKNGDEFFIIITQKSHPTAVYYTGGKTYNLGSYSFIRGDDLINRPKWTIQLRNHLGYFVVSFDGNTSQPWIISPPGALIQQTQNTNKKVEKLVVPAARMSIWGGNIASSFCFSPLTYANTATINLPPQGKRSNFSASNNSDNQNGNNNVDVNKYSLPLKGAKTAYCTIADSDSDIQGKIVASIFEKTPIYSSDVQLTKDVEFLINDTTVLAYTQPLITKSYFSLTGEYLKATGGVGRPDNVTDEPKEAWASRIELEARSIQPKEKDEIFSFIIAATLTAGDHDFVGTSSIQTVQNADSDPDDDSNMSTDSSDTHEEISYASCAKNFHLYACKTPVFTQIRNVETPKYDEDAWEVDALDVSDLVMKYDETYNSSDFHTMTHTGTIIFNMNKALTKYSNIIAQLEKLRKLAFYIEIWGGYMTCNYTLLPESKGFKLFTGICYGGNLEEKAGERTLTCQIVDYTQILKDTPIFNSPFFDGMRDVNVVYEILQMAGFKNDVSPGTDPGSINGAKYGTAYLSKIQSENDNMTLETTTLDGRGSFSVTYVLPNSYARLTSPYFKFPDGTTYWTALEKIVKKAGKVMFFDSYGMFHYENLLYDKYLYGNGEEKDVQVLWKYTTDPSGVGQIALDVVMRENSVADVFNIIHLMTATPDRELAIWDEVNWDSLYKKDSPGFLGYKKVFLQQDGIFGSLETLGALAKHYKSKFFKPPIIYKWQSYGVPMRCFDIASLNGQKLIVTNVTNSLDPQKNLWWQTIEGEWYGSEENFGSK